MKLLSITPRHFGPFSGRSELLVHPEITILTGANDAGKSSLLRCLALMCRDDQEGTLVERDVNSSYHFSHTKSWRADPQIGATAAFEVTERTSHYVVNAVLPPGVTLNAAFHLAPEVFSRKVIGFDSPSKIPQSSQARIDKMPLTIMLPRRPDTEIRDEIPLADPNVPERELLELAFDSAYDQSRWTEMSEAKLLTALAKAEDRLTRRFRTLFSEHSQFAIKLRSSGSAPSRQLTVQLLDAQSELTPLGYRGAGIRKVMRLFSVLCRAQEHAGHVYLLIDEPENSLHPDAQHFLRGLLEDVATAPHVQVLVATHSPAMINPMRPECVRLIERSTKDDVAISLFNNKPAHSGFLGVRASLGLSIADTLHLAPVTLIVEGVSEAYGIPLIVQKLAGHIQTFSAGLTLLGNIAIWDCEGDNFDRCCGIAKSQRLNPILWLDGDKRQKLEARKHKTKHLQDVPIIELEPGKEFEDLLPRDAYFRALSQLAELPASASAGAFNEWELANCPAHSKEMFTKRVSRWVETVEARADFNKVEVLRLAIEQCDAQDIVQAPFLELLLRVSRLLGRTNTATSSNRL